MRNCFAGPVSTVNCSNSNSAPRTRLYLRAEAEVLLCCARTHPDAEATARLARLLRQPLDWEEILRTAEQHRLVLLLQRHLRGWNTLVRTSASEASMHAKA